MSNHEHFEELCALAAVGQLAPEEHAELNAHLGECSSCRKALSEMAGVADTWIPAATGLPDTIRSLPLRSTGDLRDRFLSRARDRGIHLTQQSDTRPAVWTHWPLRLGKPYLATTAAAACVLAVTFFLVRWDQRSNSLSLETHDLRAQINDLQNENALLKEKVSSEEEKRVANQATSLGTAVQLATVQRERDEARSKVESLHAQVSETIANRDQLRQQLDATRADLTQLSQNYTAANRDLTSVRAERDSERGLNRENQALIAAQERKIAELAERPRVENADLDRERQLLTADRDIRELMAARNLHIIDVHDRDSKGKVRRSFGRVFYTEGKSLIFYAYDLSDSKLKDASFQVWGNREDGTRKAVSLGLFYQDDKQQSRWVLRFNDPAVLAQIDSVFVTIEPPGGGKKPSGEKLLYAFLNFDANHP